MAPVTPEPNQRPSADFPVCYFADGETLRSRSVSPLVLTGTVDVPVPPPRLLADWQRDISEHLGLEAGDVESLSLARARTRWPDYRNCVQAMAGWTETLGLPALLGRSEVALMACRGARYHHDGLQYGANAFCNLFLSEEQGLDLHFPAMDLRIPLARGTTVLFDTCQPHAVIRRGHNGFEATDFPPGASCDLVFLTWELPIGDPHLANRLAIRFDFAEAQTRGEVPQVQVNGVRAEVCPASGVWRPAD